MEAREITFVSRGVGLIKGAHSKWASHPGRWWWFVPSVLLAFIFEGPQQWLANRLLQVSALLELPNHLWGQWLIVSLAFGCIIVGMIRTSRLTKEIESVKKDSAADIAAQEEGLQKRVDAARIEGTIAGFAQASMIPQKMADYYSFHRDVVLLDDAIIEMGHRIRDYKRRCARWLGDESFKSDHVTRQSDLTPSFLELTREKRFMHFTPPPFRDKLPMDLLHITRVEDRGIPTDFSLYEPSANAAFRDRLTRFIASIDSYHGGLGAFRNKQFEALNKMAGELQRTSLR